MSTLTRAIDLVVVVSTACCRDFIVSIRNLQVIKPCTMTTREARSMKELSAEADELRRFAFYGIAVSTIAVITAVVAVPLLYNYTQYVQSGLEDELSFCLHRTHNLWSEYGKVRE